MRKQYCVAKELENLDHPDGVKCIILGISLNEDLFHQLSNLEKLEIWTGCSLNFSFKACKELK